MQQVIWCIKYKDGSQVYEFEQDGRENSFIKNLERKKDFEVIGLIDTVNNLKYVIDLKNGEFILNGLVVGLSKNIDGRNYHFTGLSDVNYSDGVIHYKCSVDMPMGGVIKPATFNIGYKIPWTFKYIVQDNHGEVFEICITHVQPMITVDANTLKVSVSILMTSTSTDKNGHVRTVKL